MATVHSLLGLPTWLQSILPTEKVDDGVAERGRIAEPTAETDEDEGMYSGAPGDTVRGSWGETFFAERRVDQVFAAPPVAGSSADGQVQQECDPLLDPLGNRLRAWLPARQALPARDLLAPVRSAPPLFPIPTIPVLSRAEYPATDLARELFADRVTGRFSFANATSVMERVRELPGIDRYIQRVVRSRTIIRPLAVDDVIRVIYEREMAFCGKLIRRMAEIYHDLRKRRASAGGVSIELTTTMLYDVDATLWDEALKFRPCLIPLLEFLRNEFPNLRMGLATTRIDDVLMEQLRDPECIGSLTEIVPYLDLEGIYLVSCYDLTSRRNARYYDYTVVGMPAPTLANIMGWSEEDVRTFRGVVLPDLIGIWAGKVIDSGHLLEFMYQSVNEHCSRLEAQDRADRRLARLRAGIPREFAESFEPARHVDHDRDEELDIGLVAFLLHMATILFEQRFDGVGLDEVYLPKRYRRLLKTFWERYQPFVHVLQGRNTSYLRHIIVLLGGDPENASQLQRIEVLLQRVAAARRELERGKSCAAIVIDDDLLADRIDQLLTGRIIAPDGIHHVDGHTLLGLSQYRGRVFIVSVGARGAFQSHAIGGELAALP